MAKEKEVYKCEVCGNIVEVLHGGAGELVCCGQSMKLMSEKISDEGLEKHVPVIEGKVVKVGSVAHPMSEEHYIEWVEATNEFGMEPCKKFLKPGEKPEVEFPFPVKYARAYCNIHGLWKS